jgi:hypothetical protein
MKGGDGECVETTRFPLSTRLEALARMKNAIKIPTNKYVNNLEKINKASFKEKDGHNRMSRIPAFSKSFARK